MIRFFRYDLNSEFESNKESLNQLDNYVALTEDNQTIHYKPLPNIFYVTTNNTGTTIYKRTDSGSEQITLENGENTLTDWNYGFYFNYGIKQEQITSFDFSKYDTYNVTNMDNMFYRCSGLTSLDVSKFNTSMVTDMYNMFSDCIGLTSLDLSNFDTSNVKAMNNMFYNCNKLTHIKCKQSFKDWCITNQDTIKLPTAMRDNGEGQWEIVQ